jgi:hypothetical protein
MIQLPLDAPTAGSLQRLPLGFGGGALLVFHEDSPAVRSLHQQGFEMDVLGFRRAAFGLGGVEENAGLVGGGGVADAP